jgi:hypothetical protein
MPTLNVGLPGAEKQKRVALCQAVALPTMHHAQLLLDPGKRCNLSGHNFNDKLRLVFKWL